MKFLATIAIMLGFVLNANAAGQTASGNILGKANVAAQVAVTGGTPLDFKNITPGVPKTIGFTNNVTAGTVTGSETTGHFTITKGVNTQVTLSFTTLPTTLAGKAGGTAVGESLPIAYTAQLSKNSDIHSIAPPVQGNTVPVSNILTTIPFYAAADFQLDLGGTVSPISTQVAGDYESTITLTATYN